MPEKIDMRDAFFLELTNTALDDERIIVLSADHGATALIDFEKKMPNRFLNIGIAEQNMISVAAGLASKGRLPVVYGIAPFVSLRVLEQITLDVAAMSLPVTIASIGSGFAYNIDGPTHHGLQDVSAIQSIPQISIMNSSDPKSTREFARATSRSQVPRYVRLEKGMQAELWRKENSWFERGWGTVRDGDSGGLVLSTGTIVHNVLLAAERLEKLIGVSVTVVDVHQLEPLPESGLFELIDNSTSVAVIEEQYPALSKSLTHELARRKLKVDLNFLNVPRNYFFQGGTRDMMMGLAGVSLGDVERFLEEVAKEWQA